MRIRVWWESVVTTWKKLRPVRRRRSSARFSVETFEPRRLLSAFVVNSIADSQDAMPGDGIAADANGFTTLRSAIEEANAHFGADTITLPAGVIVVSPANGPLVVTDDLTIIGTGVSEIDGTAFDEVFLVGGPGPLQLDNVAVRSSHDLAASLRPTWLTTNTRQTDLIVAFSATPSSPLTAETKTLNGLSSLIGITTSESIFDESPAIPVTRTTSKPATLGDSAVPTPEQAIDQIINALFRNESDLVVPAKAEQPPGPISEDRTQPMSKTEMEADEKSSRDDESMSSDDERSLVTPSDDETFRTVLRSWADDAGWNEFDFLTRGSRSVATQSSNGRRVAAMVGLLFSGVVTQSWSRNDRGSWRTRFDRLRRRAR